MSAEYAGWKYICHVKGCAAYYHKSRDIFAIERDHMYLGALTQHELDILDGIVEERRGPDYRERPIGPGVSRVIGSKEVF